MRRLADDLASVLEQMRVYSEIPRGDPLSVLLRVSVLLGYAEARPATSRSGEAGVLYTLTPSGRLALLCWRASLPGNLPTP